MWVWGQCTGEGPCLPRGKFTLYKTADGKQTWEEVSVEECWELETCVSSLSMACFFSDIKSGTVSLDGEWADGVGI